MNVTRRELGLKLACVMAGVRGLVGQPNRAPDDRRLLGRKSLPSFLRRPSEQLGGRLSKEGQELITQSGQIEVAGSNFPITAFRQLPNLLKVDVGGGRGRVLAFDGVNGKSSAVAEDLDEEIVESLTEDTLEGLLAEVSDGAEPRLLGLGFRPDPRKFPTYTGPSYDIVELTHTAKSRGSKGAQTRRYYFDSATGLLLRTYYGRTEQGRLVMHETRFEVWTLVQGNQIPLRVERLADGRRRFLLTTSSVAVGTALADTGFSDARR